MWNSTCLKMSWTARDPQTAIGEARRKTEVIVRRLDKESIQLFSKAKGDEIDQWISNGVVSVSGRAGILLERIMTMRWKPPEEVGGARHAKARLVVTGNTDPDLTTDISIATSNSLASLLFQTM